ncbi:TPA: MptD family putative ECF transporter S component [Streptococcus agalactiae]
MTTSIDDDEKTVWQTQGKPISEHDEILIVDKARKLKDGNYQIAGRIKEIINRAGEKITPLELEEILLTHDCINSVQVLGVPDKLHGEAIAVFILKSESKRLTLEEVRKFLVYFMNPKSWSDAMIKKGTDITYIESMNAAAADWMIYVIVIGTFLVALLSAWIGMKLLKKQFEKAGIV